ncbi:Oligopeptide transporter OPT superfamily [Corchorus olitorius]|uniref:Oligopeptide transporter OPT superfamily n=1 Tax=Corchorus olitorius TaxID=93759 RepID=A0A1R3GHF6_9ROSI|nr:Oligopeptide transporter OPT superfamily [Corchorus olitorius]
MPPASPLNYTSWILVGTIFNFFVFRYRKQWWMRYNYILSAALDAGVAFMTVLLYFALDLENRHLHWWGSDPDIVPEHCDFARCPTAKGISIDGCPTF